MNFSGVPAWCSKLAISIKHFNPIRRQYFEIRNTQDFVPDYFLTNILGSMERNPETVKKKNQREYLNRRVRQRERGERCRKKYIGNSFAWRISRCTWKKVRGIFPFTGIAVLSNVINETVTEGNFNSTSGAINFITFIVHCFVKDTFVSCFNRKLSSVQFFFFTNKSSTVTIWVGITFF